MGVMASVKDSIKCCHQTYRMYGHGAIAIEIAAGMGLSNKRTQVIGELWGNTDRGLY